MPIWVASIVGGLISVAGTLVGRVLLSLGIAYVTFRGVDTSITWARDFAMSHIQALPANAVAIAGLLQIGTFISILTSALVVRLTMSGLTSGALKKMVVR